MFSGFALLYGMSAMERYKTRFRHFCARGAGIFGSRVMSTTRAIERLQDLRFQSLVSTDYMPPRATRAIRKVNVSEKSGTGDAQLSASQVTKIHASKPLQQPTTTISQTETSFSSTCIALQTPWSLQYLALPNRRRRRIISTHDHTTQSSSSTTHSALEESSTNSF